ncbi:MAG: hypothetical protein L0287_16175, partial [Anaerolineae bacterium]|nr:hypothetical protein [Anaerolineae bacterium]
MTKKLGVLIIHGMGRPAPDYADKMIGNLSLRLGAHVAEVEFESCHWSPVIQKHQDRIWERVAPIHMNPMTTALRIWALHYLGDPATYLSGYFQNGKPIYREIHEKVRQSLERLAGRLGEADSKPLVILAHSLGSIIITNYYWDEGSNGIGLTPFERLETLTGLITYGSPISIFLPPVSKIMCIRFPSVNLPPHLLNVASWLNVYDRDDIVASPLNNVWDDAQGTVIKDAEINVGNPVVSWTPLAHTYYNNDPDFLDLVQMKMNTILDAV